MPVQYRAFFMMFSELLIDFLSPIIDIGNIDALHNRAVEFVCLFQGLFPQTEHHIVFHFLIHIAKHIPLAGITKNWCSWGGERGNSWVKKFLKKGGRNFEYTLETRLHKHENNIMKKV